MTYTNYPYNMYPLNSYTPYVPQQTVQYGQQSGTALNGQQPQPTGIIWVDGEVGAKAHQLPAGWPANTPMPLWDTNDTIIYLKSTNPMGMPNPLQKIHYRMEEPEQKSGNCSYGYAGPALMSGEDRHDDFVTKDDLERMKQEIRDSITEAIAGQHADTKKGAKTE